MNNDTFEGNNESKLTANENKPIFYGWECVSLNLEYRTFDFVIDDKHYDEKYILINAVQSLIHSKNNNYMVTTLLSLRLLSIKMKISYEALK